ncbi:MAG: caspase family protein [Planctomycetota bacterium]
MNATQPLTTNVAHNACRLLAGAAMNAATAAILRVVFCLAAAGSSAHAAGYYSTGSTAGPAADGYHALLIGVGDYENEDLAPLEYAANDVDRLAAALTERGEYRPANVWRCTDNSPAGRTPTAKNLRATVEAFLGGLTAKDSALIYFSGHGCRGDAGALFLAPKDYDPANQAATGLPADWLREQLAACPAKVKFLVLDSCYAGAEGRYAGADQLRGAFNEVGGVLTLASSSGEERSIVDGAVEQSLFGYWLTKALTGHADTNMDARLTFSEVYEYVRSYVERDARVRHGVSQTPRQNVGFDVDGVPAVSTLTPQPIAVVLDDMAEQIAWLARSERFGLVGTLPEFSARDWDEGRLRSLLKDTYGSLGRRLADELRDRIQLKFAAAGVRSQLVSPQLVTKALAERRLTPDQITTAESPFGAASAGKDCVMLNGQIRVRQGDMLLLQTTVIQNGRDAHTVGGRARLTLDDWAELGRSYRFAKSDFRQRRTSAYKQLSREASAIAAADEALAAGPTRAGGQGQISGQGRAAARHPMQDPTFPYRVKLLARGADSRGKFQHRRPVYRDGKAYVGLDQGENYVIDIEYGEHRRLDSGKNIYAKILVDGVSILGTRFDRSGGGGSQASLPVPTPRPTVTGRPSGGRSADDDNGDRPVFKGVDLIRVARPNALAAAQEWVLPRNRTSVRYEGFYPEGDGDVCRFLVVDAVDSIGASRAYGQNVGLITVVFYREVGSPRGGVAPGTAPGQKLPGRRVQRVKREGYVGDPIAVVHLNYASTEAVAQIASE